MTATLTQTEAKFRADPSTARSTPTVTAVLANGHARLSVARHSINEASSKAWTAVARLASHPLGRSARGQDDAPPR